MASTNTSLWKFYLLIFLLLLFGATGLLAKRSYDARLAHIEHQQATGQEELATEIGDIKGTLGTLTVDDSAASGSVSVHDGTTTQDTQGSLQGPADRQAAPAQPGGIAGPQGIQGPAGATGPQGTIGPQGPSGIATCPNGNCLSIQTDPTTVQETGSIDISGDGSFGGSLTADGSLTVNGGITANSFQGNGANLTNVDSITLNGNTAGNSSGQIALNNGTLNTNLNADLLDGQHGSFYQNADNINTGTLSDGRLSGNVTLAGNTFNGNSQLVQLTAGGLLPSLDGSNLQNVNASQLGGQSASYYTNASNISSGTLSDGRLSSNVALKDQTNTFTGTNNFQGITATGILQNGFGVCDASNNCNYASASGSNNYIQNGTTLQTANFNISGNGLFGGNVGIGTTSPGYKLDVVDTISGGGDAWVARIRNLSAVGGSHGLLIETAATTDSSRPLLVRQTDGTNFLAVKSNGFINIGNVNPTTNLAKLGIVGDVSGHPILLLRGASGQTADLFRVQDSSANIVARISASGQIFQGANQVCDTSNNCNYAASSGGSGYIQNQTASPQTAGFNISGNGTIGGALLVQGGISSPGVGANSEAFGLNASAAGNNSVAVGGTASATGNNTVAIGRNAAASSGGSIAIGNGANASAISSLAIGTGANASGTDYSTAIGINASAGGRGTALGWSSSAQGGNSVALGREASSAGSGSVAIGRTASAAVNRSIAIGYGATTTAAGQLVIGSSDALYGVITQGYFGNGVTAASPTSFTFNASGGEGENIQGGNIAIAGGRGTGNAAGGDILFQTSAPGASGTALRNLTTRAQIHGGSGNMSIGTTSDLGQLAVVNTNAAQVGLVVQGAASQSANLQQWRDSSGTLLSGVNSDGHMLVRGSTETYAGFRYIDRDNPSRGVIVGEAYNKYGLFGAVQAGSSSTAPVYVAVGNANSSNGAYMQLGIGSTNFGIDLVAGGYGAGGALRVQTWNGVSGTSTHTTRLEVGHSNNPSVIIRSQPTQTADLLQARDSTNVVLARIDASGNLTVKSATVEGSLTVVGNANFEGDFITFSNNVRGYNVSVADTETTLDVTFPTAHTDANYAVMCTPNWDTTCFVSDKTTTGFTLNYGNAAGPDALVDWFVVR